MNYSDVLRTFYALKLSEADAERIDRHFSACVHHFQRWLEADGVGPAQFHQERWLAHLRHLMLGVYQHAGFDHARDESLRGLEQRERWNPDDSSNEIPDPKMLADLVADGRYPVGIPHELDRYLTDLRDPAFHTRLSEGRGVRLQLVGNS